MPDSAFAYIDSKGTRRLPIHDEAHVRAALARFSQVVFESEEALDRARTRLLKAAKRHGIVPVGFITGQLRAERRTGRGGGDLPTGNLTLLMTDIEGSTALLGSLGDGYARVLNEALRLIRRAVLDRGGVEVEARADEFFAVFTDPRAAVDAAVDVQLGFYGRRWPKREPVKVRVGIHSGRLDLTTSGYVGLAVNTAARVCFTAHGGQVVITGATQELLGEIGDLTLRDLGTHPLTGLPERHHLFQVDVDGLPNSFPALRTADRG